MKNNNIKLRKFIVESILKEADAKEKEKKTPNELNKMIGKVRDGLIELNLEFVRHGLPETSSTYTRIENMSHLLADLDPVQIKMKDKFSPVMKSRTQMGVEQMVGENEDIKMDADADRNMEKKVVDMSKKYEMDVQMTDESFKRRKK